MLASVIGYADVHINGEQGRDKVCPVVVVLDAAGSLNLISEDIARHKWALQGWLSACSVSPEEGYCSRARIHAMARHAAIVLGIPS